MQSAVSSCPGKVLITGGYLILDRQYSGIVISLDAKFSTRVSYLDLSNSISVKSTQFLDPDIIYRIDYSDTIININSPIPSYVSKTLFYCLNIANHLATDSIIPILKLGISIEFTASDDFYSSDPNKCLLVDVRKTGLGSSAAMIASLVSSLFLYFNILSKDDIANKRLIHNVSQICHSIAQGKIGSGFDISAAVYGSHIYQRYSPSYIDQFLSNPMSDNWLKEFHKIAFETWDCIVESFSLPPGLYIKLVDVNSGSYTPKLVSLVLEWKIRDPINSHRIMSQLAIKNLELKESFKELSFLESSDPEYYNVLDQLSRLSNKTVN